MGLEDYVKKRDFTSSPEPEGQTGDHHEKLRFVVQRHDARRLHYDLRLEMEGVLKSWAVPKGPSMNPDDKRLAIHTEDHPTEYLDFEGTIPKGNYGAGEMIIWDQGTYKPASKKGKQDYDGDPVEQFEKGNMKIEFSGKKLRGKFALVSMKKDNQWLLIKKDDEFATKLDYDAEDFIEVLPDAGDGNFESESGITDLSELVKPMLAVKAKKIFDDPDWIFELKWDGYRAVANINNGEVQLYSRNGISYNQKFAPVADGLKTIPHNVILDGEIVLLDEDGKPQFQKLQNYSPDDKGDLRYFVFDLLHLNGHDTTGLTLKDRKSLLPEVIGDAPHIYFCDHITERGKEFYKKAIEAGIEGVIAKKADSKYYPGHRSGNWLKVKSIERQEAIICGYTEGNRLFGSLILGIYEGDKLTYIGNCGSGFDEDTQKEILDILKPLESDKKPFEEKINLKGRKPIWVKPEVLCEVVFSEWTDSNSMRHPVFKGLRYDKAPPEITREEIGNPSDEKKEEEAEESSTKKNSQKTKSHQGNTLDIDGISVPVTNLEKVYWPDEGYTKYDLIEYYAKIADVMVPYLINRPQNMNRHPNGIKEKGFYQKDSGGILPDWVESVNIYSESSGKNIEYMLCQNRAALIYMANLGCIEINPWNSKIDSLDNPDYTVIDIDPSKKTTFEEVIEVAQVTKEVLDRAGIRGYCKTTGSRGMHVYLPMEAKYSYEEARNFTKLLCYYIKEELPKLTTMERSLSKRKGKIYLDYLQNRRGQTLAAAYCLRPKPGATASAPLLWSEVKPGLDMKDFNIHTMPKRAESMDDPFKGVLGEGIDIQNVLETLGEDV